MFTKQKPAPKPWSVLLHPGSDCPSSLPCAVRLFQVLWICFSKVLIKPGHFHGNWHLRASWTFAWILTVNCAVVLVYLSMMMEAGRGWGTMLGKVEKNLPLMKKLLHAAAWLAMVVTKYRSVLSSSKGRLWFGGDIPTWLCSALVGSIRDAAVAAFFATPGQTHSNRALCVAICYELHLSLTCSGKALGLAQLCAGYLQTVPEALLHLKSLKD